MNKHQILMDMRNEHTLKGLKPCFVILSSANGKLYTGSTSDFIMSLKKGVLYFQRLSMFFHTLKPKDDVSYPISTFIEYKIVKKSSFSSLLYLYTKEGNYIQISYQTGLPDTQSTEYNLSKILEELEEAGIKQAELEDSNDEEA